MVAAVVTFDGTRVDPLDTNTNTGHWVGSGGAPAAEAPLAYQNSLAVNKKTTASTLAGIDFDPGAGALDMTAAAHRLWFVKVYVSDSFDVNATFGVAAGIGSALADHYKYNIAGSGAALPVYSQYPAQGGYILTAIDPNIAAWRDGSGAGTPDLTIVDWFGVQCAMITGAAKAENLAFDAIDVGTGLTILSGDGASTEGNFTDYVAADQDAPTIRWGCVSGSGDAVRAWCLLTIGAAGTATEFLDNTSIVTFSDGYHSRGLVGTFVDIGNASSIIQIGATLIGEGTRNGVDANDTRPDFEVTGTAGSFDFTGQMRNHRDVTFTSVCDIVGADIECMLLVQNSSNISDTIIRCNALTSVAVLQDPIFGTTTDLHDTTFLQNGAGHAIEIAAAGDYTFTNLFFAAGTAGAWGATTSASAMIDVTASSGIVNITVAGGTAAITYLTAGATVNIIASVPVNIDGITEGSSVKLIARETLGVVTTGDTLAEGFVDSALNFNYAHNDEGSLDISVVARNQGIAVACIAEDGGVFVDETAEGSSNATADMTILPAVPVVSDAYYFAHTEEFPRLKLNLSTPLTQTGAPTIVWEYWNGAWVALSGVVDGTSGFETSGDGIVSWTAPGDWAITTVNGQGPLFYVRARITVLGTITQVPVGRRVTLDVTRYLPYDENREIVTGEGLADRPSWTEDKISKFDPAD